MPALIGAVALPLLAGLGYILDHLPKPTAEDKALRVERVTLNKQQRWNLFRSFAPILTLLFFANLFLTVLQDVKGRLSGENHERQCRRTFPVGIRQSGRCSTLIILAIFATLAVMKSHIKVLSVLLTLVIAGAITLSTVAFNYHTLQLSPARVVIYPEPLPLFFPT